MEEMKVTKFQKDFCGEVLQLPIRLKAAGEKMEKESQTGINL